MSELNNINKELGYTFKTPTLIFSKIFEKV